ncbi:ferritin-like protein [Streptomyces sp. NPDC060187]|uniref:ferritin-like domain-containing protein n=1 Tax=Streptomyces sp. NPDC060187 TaxID=3347067 RepID=UPI0036552F72
MTETKRSPEEPAATALRRRSFLASAALAATAPVAASTAAHASERSAPGRLPTPERGPAERLLAVPLKNRRDDWLQEALQIAVAVEFSTIPPYLCAWWSINDRKSEVAQLIRRVVLDEMFHLGVVCNLLVAVGGRPDIHAAAPLYPGPLPGGVHPGLDVYLSGLTKPFVHDVMMAIEAPAAPLTESGDDSLSIGTFYGELLKTFRSATPELSTARQLQQRVGGDDLDPVRTLDDVEHAIDIIREQGEGTSSSPADAPGDDHVAHYYAFAEIYHGRQLREDDDGWRYSGPVVPFPEARPMARVPAGGWDSPPDDAGRLISAFDSAYAGVLDSLEAAWGDGGASSLTAAVRAMGRLESPAVELMEMRIPGSQETYGPQFRPV